MQGGADRRMFASVSPRDVRPPAGRATRRCQRPPGQVLATRKAASAGALDGLRGDPSGAHRPQAGWLRTSALSHPPIWPAIAHMPSRPPRNWTVAARGRHERPDVALGVRRALSSPSSVGEPVMSYVPAADAGRGKRALKQEWRHGRPARRPSRLEPVRGRVRARAFKRVIGVSPGAIRTQRRRAGTRADRRRRGLSARQRHGVDAFVEVTSRATFAVPPRAQRAYPHRQERSHT